MVLQQSRSGPGVAGENGDVGDGFRSERSFEDPSEAQRTRENIEVVAVWIVSQVEHAIRNPIFGNFAKRRLNEVMTNFERHLVSLGLGHEAIGAVLQQAYDRVRKLVSR